MTDPLPLRPESSGGRSERSARRRERILDAAADSFCAVGFAKTTVEGIAERAGVSKGLVYHHFGGKEEVLTAVLERTLSEWDAVSEGDLTGAESALGALGAMQRAGVAYARENPLLRAFFDMDPLILMGLGEKAFVEAMERYRARLEAALARGVESGELHADLDVSGTAEAIQLLHGAFIEAVLDPLWRAGLSDGALQAGLALLARGLARRTS